jgi:polyhydroxyalkanoate synthase subunit PhaE
MTNAGIFPNDWLELQRKYWESWTDLSRKAKGAASPTTNPWEAAIDHWWQALSPAAPDLARDFMTKIMDQGKAFFALADGYTKNLGAMPGAGLGTGAGDGWSALSRTLEDMQKAFTGGLQGGDEASRRLMAFWELPYDNWQRLVSSMSLVPGDALRNMPHGQLKDGLNQALSAPGLGYTREEQAQYQDLVRRGIEYQQALQEYLQFFSGLGTKSIGRMRDFLETQDKPIESARALYDSWVSCCEQVYAEEVKSAEYARISGRLINAQMAVKQRMAIMVDETLGALNMPTRSELRTLQDRLQETRREYKALRHEVESLKRQLGNGSGGPRPALVRTPSDPPATPTAAAKKAPTARKVTPKPAPSK